MPDGVHSCTAPYVFFRLLVIVPAPRFTHRPRMEWPTNPSCPLFECPRRIELLISPCTLQVSPIDDAAMRSVVRMLCSPTYSGPTRRVNACTCEPARRRIGPAV